MSQSSRRTDDAAESAPDPGSAWMVAYSEGDERAFERLVEEYSGRVYSLLTRFLGQVPGREDLVQEVFLRVLRARERYRPSARFSTWLYRICFNLCANERERERVHAEVSLEQAFQGVPRRIGPTAGAPPDPVDERAADPAVRLDRSDVVEAVRAAIAALPESQRMALILAKYEGLPYAEIAEVLGSSEKAIKSLIHRARENLRVRLAPFLLEEFA